MSFGVAITIVAPSDKKALEAIERLTGQTINWIEAAPPAGGEQPEAGADRHGAHGGRPREGARRSARPKSRRPNEDTAPARNRKEPAHRPAEDADTSHLPAFLLRPVPLKA